MTTVIAEGRVTPKDRREAPYVYVPFDVVEGTTRIDIRYRHDAGSILDLGMADPRLDAFPSRAGFRGWSGGARTEAFVATDGATPGYLAGPIPAGRWHVMLGLARVEPGGCSYRVEIDMDSTPRGTAEPVSPPVAARPGAAWYRGDLQSHTHHSDARGSLADLVRAATDRGLDFLAVTDHNTVSHHRGLTELSSPTLVLLPGEEVTTYRGHANVWGVAGWTDFRMHRDDQVDGLVEHVHARGGLFSVNHPKSHVDCIGCDWEYPVPSGADCFEAWQGPWLLRNWESVERYDALLRNGRRLTLVGGSDRHQPAAPDTDPDILKVGSPTTWVWLPELSAASLLDGLRSGRACVGESPEGPRLDIQVGGAPMGAAGGPWHEPVAARAEVSGADGDLLQWVGAEGVVREVLIEGDAFEDTFDILPDGPFLRAEIRAKASLPRLMAEAEAAGASRDRSKSSWAEDVVRRGIVRALSNPVYRQSDR